MPKVIIDGVTYAPVPEVKHDGKMLAALEVRFDSDAGDDLTVRDYLRKLLSTLLDEEESFSGKRPFGNSGWTFEIINALAKAGFIDLGEADGCGDYNSTREQDIIAYTYVGDLILAAFYGVSAQEGIHDKA